ncbi:MAG: hypothetical protein VKK04_01665 [Synechococcales bacterium]|nr:hypothetical protein [Synechococcales bacterium]
MTPEELAQIAATQQMILTRHDREMADIRASLDRAAAYGEITDRRLEAMAQRQEAFDQRQEAFERRQEAFDQRFEAMAQRQEAFDQRIDAMNRQSELNQQAIATLVASIQELRNLVADYLQGRSQVQPQGGEN